VSQRALPDGGFAVGQRAQHLPKSISEIPFTLNRAPASALAFDLRPTQAGEDVGAPNPRFWGSKREVGSAKSRPVFSPILQGAEDLCKRRENALEIQRRSENSPWHGGWHGGSAPSLKRS